MNKTQPNGFYTNKERLQLVVLHCVEIVTLTSSKPSNYQSLKLKTSQKCRVEQVPTPSSKEARVITSMFTLLNRVIKTTIIAETTETSGEAIINASVDRSLLRMSTQTGAPQLDFVFPPSFRTIPADKSVKVHNGPRLKPRLKLFFFFLFRFGFKQDVER